MPTPTFMPAPVAAVVEPPAPQDHVGGDLPQTPQDIAAAAAAAALEPVQPPGPPPMPPPMPQPAPPVAGQATTEKSWPVVVVEAQSGEAAPPVKARPKAPLVLLDSPITEQLAKSVIAANAAKNKDGYYLVVAPDGEPGGIECFEDLDGLKQRIIKLLEKEADVGLFPFIGKPLQLHRSRNLSLWMLETPLGLIPLYNQPDLDELELVKSGWIGKEPQELVIPDTPPQPAAITTLPVVVPGGSDEGTPIFGVATG